MHWNARTLFLVVATFFAVLIAAPQDAAAQFRVGAGGGYNIDRDDPLITIDSWIGLVNAGEAQRLNLSPGVTFNVGETYSTSFDLDFIFSSDTSGFMNAYIGPGMNLRYRGGDDGFTRGNFNVVYGMLFNPEKPIEPFIEGRTRINVDFNASATEFLFGILYRFGAGDSDD